MVGDGFVEGSVAAGMALPEFQFTVKRTVQELLKEAEREEVVEMEVVTASDKGGRLIVELEMRLERDGGQPWGIGMDWRSAGPELESASAPATATAQGAREVPESIRYLLGTASAPGGTCSAAEQRAVDTKKQEKRTTVMERKRTRKKGTAKNKNKRSARKQPKRPTAIPTSEPSGALAANAADVAKALEVVSLECNALGQGECSEGELFVDVDCGVRHVVLVSQQGQVWERTATRLPRIVRGLATKVAAVACGRAHSLVLSGTSPPHSPLSPSLPRSFYAMAPLTLIGCPLTPGSER